MPDRFDLQEPVWENYARVGGAAIAELERYAQSNESPEVELKALKVRLPKERHGEWFIVLNGNASDGTPMVAFMSSDSLSGALRKAVAMYTDGSLKWRIDEYKLGNV